MRPIALSCKSSNLEVYSHNRHFRHQLSCHRQGRDRWDNCRHRDFYEDFDLLFPRASVGINPLGSPRSCFPGPRMKAKSVHARNEARRIAANGEADAYGSNCNVKLTALHRLKPSSNAKSHEGSITAWLRSSLQSMGQPSAYVRSIRGAINPHTTRTMIAPTIAPMKPAPSPG